jgi:DNA polymerase elongation subunit (family B)
LKTKIETGWILDVYVQGDEGVIWLRTVDGDVRRLTDTYHPHFYIQPTTEDDGQQLHQAFSDASNIVGIRFEERYTRIEGTTKQKLLTVTVDNASHYKRILSQLESSPRVAALFNVDLLHVQQYLCTRLKIPPTSKVEVAYCDDHRLVSADVLDDAADIAPPPFTALVFDLDTGSSMLPPNPVKDPILSIAIRSETGEQTLTGDETTLLRAFERVVAEHDPDFLVCPDVDRAVNYLFSRVRQLKMPLQLGREAVDPTSLSKPIPYGFRGRVVLGDHGYARSGIAGLVERARFSVLPPGIAHRWTANRVIDSRNCFELIQRGYVIPKNLGYYEYVRTVENLVYRDRGGLILGPAIGATHANVAEFDFESEYPNLIIKENLSYETVSPDGVAATADALLPYVTRTLLARRLYFKHLRTQFDEESPEWRWCEQRQLALKLILVCLYGTSGCCWNRYGNVTCFEEINQRSRDVLVKTKKLVQERGFEVVYGDTDSLFVTKPDATRADYEALGVAIRAHVGLPVALDHHLRYLMLLPLAADPSGNMEAQKHYFAIRTDGVLLVRGIESRRHDCPPFVKAFQHQLIRTLFDVATSDDVPETGYRNAVTYTVETVDRIMCGEVPVGELTVSQILRKPLTAYTSLFPHVSAAVTLAHHGKVPREGAMIDFVFVNTGHPNPLRRVVPTALRTDARYDRAKYLGLSCFPSSSTCPHSRQNDA